MSFKSSFGALGDARGSWLVFGILILIWIWSGPLLGSSLKFWSHSDQWKLRYSQSGISTAQNSSAQGSCARMGGWGGVGGVGGVGMKLKIRISSDWADQFWWLNWKLLTVRIILLQLDRQYIEENETGVYIRKNQHNQADQNDIVKKRKVSQKESKEEE